MPTRRPLRELIPDIVQHYNQHQEYLQFNLRLYRILEGQVRQEVEDSLRREILSKSALNRALQRIPSVNVLKKATDKLSTVYIESPIRLSDNENDKSIMENIVHESHIDNVMMEANRILNAHNTFAIEPFIKDNKHHFRVLAGHQFLPFSDDPENPKNVTVFIKLLGNEIVHVEQRGDDLGNREDNDKEIRLVDILALYSDDEFLVIDSSGRIRTDKMAEMGITSDRNTFGKIPFVIGNRSSFELVPFPNQAGFDISILIPKLLTDLNYAAQFMSHSIIWTKNADLSGQEVNPDTIIDLGDKSADDGDPEIGTIDPSVDIDRILKLIEFEMSSYFSSIGIKTSVSGSLSPGREESGVSKAINEGDTSAEKKKQTEFFREIECKLWDLMTTIQKVWVREGRLAGGESRVFSEEFVNTFRIKYAEIKALKTHKQLLDEIQVAREMKLLSRKQALRMLNPDFTEEQIQNILNELDEEAKEAFDLMMQAAVPSGSRGADGTFGEGNQESMDQQPETNLESRRSDG